MKKNKKILISLIFSFVLVLLGIFTQEIEAKENDFCYLSDINYMPGSAAGWNSIMLDKNLEPSQNGGLITLLVDGEKTKFLKGITAHATSTVLYDISNYDYDYFTAYLGLDNCKGSNGNGVKFYIYTSIDGENWELKTDTNPKVMKGDVNAKFVKIDIKDANYLKLYAHNNGNDSYDHAAYGDAKLIKEGYVEEKLPVDFIKTVEEYDEMIKAHEGEEITREYELLLLQRKFVNSFGYETLKMYGELNKENNEVLSWLMNDVTNIRYYVLGGAPMGGHYSALKILTRLYTEYKEDFDETEEISEEGKAILEQKQSNQSPTKGDLYKRMAITLSLTHSSPIGLWMQPNIKENQTDPVVRYALFKRMYNEGKFKAAESANITPWFETYTIEEMRYVMHVMLDDESTIWLNEYTQSQVDAHPNNVWGYLTPHPYMNYIEPSYNSSFFYDDENKEYFNNLFAVGDKGLFDYELTRGTLDNKIQKLWMNFRNKFNTGAVCGGISKTGHCIRGVHAIPSAVIGQPGHAAILYYTKNANGQGYWGIDNDVSGWTQSERSQRLPLGWGSDWSYRSTYNIPYVVLSQEAINDYNKLVKAEELLMKIDVYHDDQEKQEEIYREAIAEQSINLDAWYGLIKLYLETDRTEEEYYNLAEEMMEALKYFPFTVNDLGNKIKPKLTSDLYEFKYTLLVTRILTEGKNYQGTDVLQPGITRTLASSLLGRLDTELATFSFDGDDAGKIKLGSRFEGSTVRWDYSIDGKQTWNEVFTGENGGKHEAQLAPEQIESITAENDIYVHIVGVNYDENNLYKIDIGGSSRLPNNLYANDLENRLMEAVPVMEWKYRAEDNWTLYRDQEPDLTGDKTVIVRMGRTGVNLASEEVTFEFTEDNQPDTEKYIPLSRVKLHSYSSQHNNTDQKAANALDGNIYTMWHSNWNGADAEKYIVMELDEPTYISALEYYPRQDAQNGRIRSARISVSMDGENWADVVASTDWENNGEPKKVKVDVLKKAKYVRLKANTNYGDGRHFISALMINLFEDTVVTVASSFSFDGENAGKIMLEGDNVDTLSWKYSLDGGNTWVETSGAEHQLTMQEIEQITEDNKIKIKYDGIETEDTINIQKGITPNVTPYINDWENRLIGMIGVDKLEWKLTGDTTWNYYGEKEPIVEGNNTLLVRTRAYGITSASDILEYEFTEDNDTEKAKYISNRHLTIEEYSSQSVDSGRPFYAPNAIDGNANTMWHTDFRYSIAGSRAFITLKLDEARYISALEFMQRQYKTNDPCLIKNMYVYVSENNEDWVKVGRLENIPQVQNEFRKFEFEESVYGQYVKIEMEGHSMFVSLSMVNLYEDTTVTNVGEFSFTGDKRGKITLTDEFKSSNWEYSLDSGTTWTRANSESHQLTEEEIKQVNADDKIRVRINNKEYVINIKKQTPPTITAYLNDLENRLIGITNIENLEWKIEKNSIDSSGWTSYAEEEPVVEGNAKLLIRQKEKDSFTESDAVEFEFTEDNQLDARKYIPVKRLSIEGVSAEDTAQNGAAANSIDGDYNTRWLNSAAGADNDRYIIIKLDKVAYISAMDYVPHSENGKILIGKILGSIDGKDFTEITTVTGWANDQTTKTVEFAEPVKARYIKIVGEETSYSSDKRHIGARMFNFYEDITKIDVIVPTAEVKYSITEKTNKDVVATLVNESTPIKVLNNGGSKSYTFKENGEFTFEFEDAEGHKGKTTAKVDWIIKTLPTPKVEFDIKNPTNKDVTATVTFDREGTVVTNNNGSNKHTFTENGEFTFDFRGPYGNESSITVKVDWIIKTLPNAIFTYDITDKTNKDVTVTVEFDREGTVITNNNGKNTYTFTENGDFTFEFRGPYGNEGVATATVDWVDKTVPTAKVEYDILEATNGNVTATLVDESEEIIIINNEGKRDYTFTKNGEFTFEFVDKVGNKGTATAKVNWIDRTAPNGSISYNITQATNQGVVATVSFDKENVTITNNDGKNTYTFKENGEFIFEFVDKVGNKGTAKAEVSWIDKTLPVGTITYSTTNPTNQDVIATITFDKENVTVEGGATHTFTENGEYEFRFIGPKGNSGVAIAKVTWIDKKTPTSMIIYSTMSPTNQDVISRVEFDEEDIEITNNEGSNTYTFKENGEFVFEFTDKAGNSGTALAKVNWIDRTAPTATVSYDVQNKTNGNVVATLVDESEEITITNNEGNSTYTFTENGEFIFEFVDKAGNKGTSKAVVSWIDKTLPIATINYSTTNPTNQDVVAKITFDKENVTVEGGTTHTFTENGEFTFDYIDEAGNMGMQTAVVDWIDKNVPTAEITYSTTELTNKDVTVTIKFNEEVEILTEGLKIEENGNNTYTLKVAENGKYEIEYVDKAGNKATSTVEVNNIDKDVPTAEITYNTTELTNKDVTVTIKFNEEVEILTEGLEIEENGNNTYTLKVTGNTKYEVEYVDKAGNKGTATVEVSWIDKTLPKATITYDIEELTNKDVTATITFDKEGTVVTNNNGKSTYTFTENGKFTFEFKGPEGKKGVAIAKVDWIDKKAPVGSITYSTTESTSQDVIVTISFDEENVTITNNEGNNTYTFTENGEFTFEFVDKAGNTGTAKAEVSWIDKTLPVATINYSTTNPTNQNVVATITFDKEGVTVEGGATHTFTDNGEYEFKYTTPEGKEGVAIAKVTWIDRIAPRATVSYDIQNKTNGKVVATLENESEEIRITNNDGNNTYTFTENGEFTFEFVDKAGNKGIAKAVVSWIDKTLPKATIKYSTKELTNKDVVAKITFDKENVTVEGGTTHTFTENGEFTFEYTDEVGNKGTATAKVDWIDKKVPVGTITYSTTEQTDKEVVATVTFDKENVTITNNEGNNTYTFTENGEFTFEFVDKAGNKGNATAHVSWIKEDQENPDIPDEYKIGDINKDGKIASTDLLLVKRHLVAGEKQEWILTEDEFKLGDINQDGKITATDLLLIKRLVLKQMETIQ